MIATAQLTRFDRPDRATEFDPKRPDFKPYGLSCVHWKPTVMKRPDHHNEIELNLLKSGYVIYLLGGSKVRIEANQLAAFWASIPHQAIELGENTEYIVVTIPFSWFLQFNLPDPFVQTLLNGNLVCEDLGEMAEFETIRMSHWSNDLSGRDKQSQNIVLLELQARLHRMARIAEEKLSLSTPSSSKGSPHKLPEGSLNKVEQIACFIAQNYLEPLSADSIGKAVGIHPNYAMNLFKQAFGTTILNYLTHHRITHAQRLLVTTDMKILDVAMSSGFHTLSRFNEAFKQTCGCSPREYRLRQAL